MRKPPPLSLHLPCAARPRCLLLPFISSSLSSNDSWHSAWNFSKAVVLDIILCLKAFDISMFLALMSRIKESGS